MDQWGKISAQFDRWTAPLRPSPEDVAMFRGQLRPEDKILLLGVTPELQSLATFSVDNNPVAIENLKAQAILADWENLPFESEFDVLIGDGCLNAFQEPPEILFQQAKKALKPNGRLILRTFISPEQKEDLPSVFSEKGKIGFHAFKWKVAHALAAPYVKVEDLYRTIEPVWNHPTLEVYKGSNLIYYFPKLSELPPWNHIQFGKSYELSERCPVITWKFHR